MRNGKWKKVFKTKEMEQMLHQVLFEDNINSSAQQMEKRSKEVARNAISEYERREFSNQRLPFLQGKSLWRSVGIAIAVMALVVLPATKTGRTMAVKLFNWVTEWTEEWLIFKPTQDTNLLVFGDEEIEKEYSDFEILEEETGLQVVQMNTPAFRLDKIEFYYWPATGKDVTTLYTSTDSGSVVMIRQEWGDVEAHRLFLADKELRQSVFEGVEWYSVKDFKDGSLTMYAIINDSLLTIGMQNADEEIQVLESLTL